MIDLTILTGFACFQSLRIRNPHFARNEPMHDLFFEKKCCDNKALTPNSNEPMHNIRSSMSYKITH